MAGSGEPESLRRSQVELSAERIVLQPGETKNGDGRTLPIYGEMAEWLSIAETIDDAKHRACPFVFHRNGEQLSRWRKDWEEVLNSALVYLVSCFAIFGAPPCRT